ERFDHRLDLAHEAVADNAGTLFAALHHHQAFAGALAPADAEALGQAQAGQRLAAQVDHLVAGLFAELQALDHQIQRQDEVGVAHRHLETVNDRKGQRQVDAEGAALPRHAVDLHGAAQLFDVLPHHVHAHATTGQVGDLLGGGESGGKDQVVDVALGQLDVGGYQTTLDGLGQDALAVQATAVVADLDHHAAGAVVGVQRQGALLRLAGGAALLDGFDAVVHGVAHDVQ